MSRMTVKLLEAMVEDLKRRVEALERPRKRIGFEYEGSVGGDVVAQHDEAPDVGDRRRRG